MALNKMTVATTWLTARLFLTSLNAAPRGEGEKII
jgi:hypothetical protein